MCGKFPVGRRGGVVQKLQRGRKLGQEKPQDLGCKPLIMHGIMLKSEAVEHRAVRTGLQLRIGHPRELPHTPAHSLRAQT